MWPIASWEREACSHTKMGVGEGSGPGSRATAVPKNAQSGPTENQGTWIFELPGLCASV